MKKTIIDPKDQNKEEKKADDLLTTDAKQSERIVSELKKSLKLFVDDRGDAYARIKNKGHYENWLIAVRNKNFRIWVAYNGRKILGSTPSENAIREAITAFEGEAMYENADIYTLFNRVGFEVTPGEKKYWYDIADAEWSAIEITTQGWKVIKNPPILFKRYQHQLPQVIPADKNNDISLLDKYLHLSDERDRILIYAFLVTSLIAEIPHVCLVLHGPQGSAKTTSFKMLQKLIDPTNLEVLDLDHDKRNLLLNLDQSWFCPFDNLSGIKKDISNLFCQVITGAGFRARALRTDDDPFIRKIKRVIGLGGINIAAAQPDLLERSILVELRVIEKKDRRYEEELWANFEIDKTKIFGGMLDIFSKAIAIKPSICINLKPRMADFAQWGEAISRVMGHPDGYFLDAYEKNIVETNDLGVESDYVADAISVWVEEKVLYECEHDSASGSLTPLTIWDGSLSGLIKELTVVALDNRIITDERDKFWYSKAREMNRHLKKITPILKSKGIIVTSKRTSAGRRITIVYKNPKYFEGKTTNTVNRESENQAGEGNLNNKVIDDGVRVYTGDSIDMNSSTPPWLKDANKSQDDDSVGNDGELDVSKIPF